MVARPCHLGMVGHPCTPSIVARASNKLLEDVENEAPGKDQAMICPNMTNPEFYSLMLRLRDKAVSNIDSRLAEISAWGRVDQAR